MLSGARVVDHTRSLSPADTTIFDYNRSTLAEVSTISSDGTAAGSSFERISLRPSAHEPYYFQKGPFDEMAADKMALHKTRKAIMSMIRRDPSLQVLVPYLRYGFPVVADARSIEKIGLLADQDPHVARGLLKLAAKIFRRKGVTQLSYNFDSLLYFASGDSARAKERPIHLVTDREHNFFRTLAYLLTHDYKTQRVVIDAFMVASYKDIFLQDLFVQAFVAFAHGQINDARLKVINVVLKVATGKPTEAKRRIISLANTYLQQDIPQVLEADFVYLLCVIGNYLAKSTEADLSGDEHRLLEKLEKFTTIYGKNSPSKWARTKEGLRNYSDKLRGLREWYKKKDGAHGRTSASRSARYHEIHGSQFTSVEGAPSSLEAFRAGIDKVGLVSGPNGREFHRDVPSPNLPAAPAPASSSASASPSNIEGFVDAGQLSAMETDDIAGFWTGYTETAAATSLAFSDLSYINQLPTGALNYTATLPIMAVNPFAVMPGFAMGQATVL